MTPPDHPDWEALLRAVTAAPDDDTPRLVAADWLDEHDRPDRAELIRVQCALARGTDPDPPALERRERALLSPLGVNRAMWALESCPQLVRVGFHDVRRSPLESVEVHGADRLAFRRGFVELVACPAHDWLAHGAAVRGRQPVREVILTDCPGVPAENWWAGLPSMAGLRTLLVDEVSAGRIGWLRERLAGVVVVELGRGVQVVLKGWG